MMREPNPLGRFGNWVLRWHWPLLLILGFLAATVEVVEHSDPGAIGMNPDLIQEMFLVGVFVPAIAGLLLDELVRAKKRASINQANAIDAERYRLSRDVHDSLAQDISYLHFKLDQLTMSHGRLNYQDTYRQLEQVRDIACQAYRQIYDMLGLLRIPASAALPEVLFRHAQRIGERAQFEVRFTNLGEACLLAPDLRQQLLFVYGEILRNVEKHAAARHVDVQVTWKPGEVTIRVSDDGRGFDPQAGFPEHYGLAIMRERAHDIGAQLTMDSQPGRGTEVRLSVSFDPCQTASPQHEFDRWPTTKTSWQEIAQ